VLSNAGFWIAPSNGTHPGTTFFRVGGRRTDLPPLSSFDGGMAGRSARREYDRRAERRRRTLRARFPVIGGFLYTVLPEPQTIGSWSSGSVGESAVGRRLDSLSKYQVIVLHDRRIPKRASNIDHIAVGPSGVFVIDTKRYQGARVKKSYLGPIWNPGPAQLIVRGRNCTNLVSKAFSQGEAVASALSAHALSGSTDAVAGRNDVKISRMLVFVESDWGIFTPPFEIDGVWIGTPKQMAKVVARPGPLDPDTIQSIARHIAASLKPA
jgi:hypothetical protein